MNTIKHNILVINNMVASMGLSAKRPEIRTSCETAGGSKMYLMNTVCGEVIPLMKFLAVAEVPLILVIILVTAVTAVELMVMEDTINRVHIDQTI